MRRIWALLAIAFALAFSGLASFTDHTTQATNDSIRVDGGLVDYGSHEYDQAIAELEQASVTCGPIYNLDEALNDPQVNASKTCPNLAFRPEEIESFRKMKVV